MSTPPQLRPVTVHVNGETVTALAEPRMPLSAFIRETIGLTGTNVGCEHGVCGACTVLVDGRPVRGCLMLAVQVDGATVETVESLGDGDELSPLQAAFRTAHGLQCGFCTPGMLLTSKALLEEHPDPDEEQIRDYLHGNLCRCTGYQQIVESVQLAAKTMREEEQR